MAFTSTFLVRSTIALLVTGFLALLAIVAMTIWLGERAQVYFDEVIEARDTRASAVELRNAIQTAEASQRGFLLTGNEIYLAPYGVAKTMADRQFTSLKRNLVNYPEAQIPLQRISSILAEKFAEMDTTIALKRSRQDAEALAIIRTNRGKALMDEANVFFSGIIRAADQRLTTGVSEQNANATTLRWASIVSAIVIVLVVGGVASMVTRYTRELTQTRSQIAALNTGLETRVAERTSELAQANEELQRFAYIVTHDLRAPLVNIMGFTSELEAGVNSLQALIDKSNATQDVNDPTVREAQTAAKLDLPEAIGFIRTSTKKMDNLINAILKLSREGRRKLQMQPVRLEEVIKASASAIQHQLSEANGEIEFDLAVPIVVTDKISAEHVFGNLLENAVKYRSKDRPLRVDVRSRQIPGGRVSIEITDNGRGIAEHDRERVFDLFRRSGIQDQPGEGIGLAYVRTVVRNLGGDISVTSELGIGSTFRVVLPAKLEMTGSTML